MGIYLINSICYENKLKLFFLSIPIVVSSCDLQKGINDDTKFLGTTKGAVMCIEKNKQQSELISEKLVKNQCVKKHEIEIDHILNAVAKVYIHKSRITVSGIDGKNTYDDKIITSMSIKVTLYDEEGIQYSGVSFINNLWVLPNTSFHNLKVDLYFDYNKEDYYYDWCSNKKDNNTACKEWGIESLRGLEVLID